MLMYELGNPLVVQAHFHTMGTIGGRHLGECPVSARKLPCKMICLVVA